MNNNASPTSIKEWLPLVRKPGRYIGGEVNSITKDLSTVRLKFGMAFPDAYEVGMSHLGIQILYQILNARQDVACERVFAPWLDMEALLREKGIRLSTLESGIALDKLDILGFSLQYELSYTNVLNMLELGGITLDSASRRKDEPFIIGGGPVAYNPEPVADFFDAFLLGDGEDAVLEISDAVIQGRAKSEDRIDILRRLSKIDGVYVPSFFDVSYNADGTVKKIVALAQGSAKIKKRVVPDINDVALPLRPVVPNVETIHDRVTVEITRGCTRGCRFCQAGMIYRPVRERRPENVVKIVRGALANTGYDEVSLLSLSAGDYTLIEDLLAVLMGRFVEGNVALSLPSLRVGTLSATLAGEIKKVRKTGFTLAPEAGSERMRTLINKGIKEEDLLKAANAIFTLGWRALKLYFMIGLPGETDDDVAEIARLADCVKKVGKLACGGRAPQINVGLSTFIPKPFTPFQWEPQITLDECLKKHAAVRKRLSALKLGFKWHEPEMSVMEGVFSRGDRRLGRVILSAFKKGCRFDGWGEEFKFGLWQSAFKEAGMDPAFYTHRRRPLEEVFPWDHLDPGVTKPFLYGEWKRAVELSNTPDCKVDRCGACGVCDHKVIKNIVAADSGFLKDMAAETMRQGQVSADGKRFKTPSVRMRLRFSKTAEARFLSHLELVSAVTRALRRANIPVKYSEGFHPLPKLSFSQPLPVGMESLDEYMDIEVEDTGGAMKPDELMERLNKTAPMGLRFLAAQTLSLQQGPASAIIKSEEYLIFLENGPLGLKISPENMDGILRDFHGKASVIVRIVKEKRTDEVDIKPLVGGLALAEGGALRLILRKGESKNIRPHDVLAGLFGISRADASLIPVLKIREIAL